MASETLALVYGTPHRRYETEHTVSLLAHRPRVSARAWAKRRLAAAAARRLGAADRARRRTQVGQAAELAGVLRPLALQVPALAVQPSLPSSETVWRDVAVVSDSEQRTCALSIHPRISAVLARGRSRPPAAWTCPKTGIGTGIDSGIK